MQKLRAKKYENESAGILRNNTLPLLIYGKIDWNQGKEKQRDGFINECYKIISNRGRRAGTTTYPGVKTLHEKLDLPIHHYHQITFYSKDAKSFFAKNIEVQQIKSLADRESKVSISNVSTYEASGFLLEIRHIISKRLYNKRMFNDLLANAPYVKEIMANTEINEQEADKYPFLLGACSCHLQDADSIDLTCQYVPHIDKTGTIAAFYQLTGVSYNFVAVQTNTKD